MHSITVIWSMISSACLTLAAVHGLVWWRRRNAHADGLFAASAMATAIYVGCELWMMHSLTPAEYGTALRWAHVPLWLVVISLVAFVRAYLQAGRAWLAWSVISLHTISVVVNFLAGANLNFQEVTGIKRVWMLGSPVSVATGVTNPWMLIGQISSLLLLIFVIDASITVFRRGEHRKALVVGGGIVFFVLAATLQVMLALTGAVRMPVTISFFYIGVVVAMGYELSRELNRALQLADDLRESEMRFSLSADIANLGVWTRDLVQNQMWATPRWRALFGFSDSEKLEFDNVLQRVHPDDRSTLSQAISQAVAAGGGYETEYRVVHPDGRTHWIASRGRADLNGGHKPVFMRGVSIDITERRQSENEAQELRQRLAHAGRVTMLGQLASSLAHELSQPLGAILHNAEAAEMLMQNGSPDLEELRSIIADIQKDDQRAGAVIDRLRSLLKRRSLDPQPLSVTDLFDEVMTLVRSDAAARRVKLMTSVPHNLPLVRGDRVHLLQVLLNLIINGMDAVETKPDSERSLTLQARHDENGVVEIAVADSGAGISTEKTDHLFEPFFTTKAAGMGMGLPISRTIVEAHGGRIWAERNTDCGTTFRFTLCASGAGNTV